jgi:glycosyltransferase involved in cell wall biosynthesis
LNPPADVNSVLFVTYHFPPEIGGIHTRISHYVRELRRRGIAVTVFVITTRGQDVRRYSLDGADVYVCPGELKFFGRNATYLLKSAFSERADVIHVFTGASTFFGIFSLFVGRLKRVPSVISFFGKEQFETVTLIQRAMLPFSLRLATSIGVNTPYTRGLVPEAFRGKTHVLLGGAELSEPVSSPRFNGKASTILFVGRLIERKGEDDLIKALQLVREKCPQSRLVLVGDGPDRKRFEDLARSLDLSGDVEFRGTLTGRALNDAYEESSVVVLPSKHVKGDSSSETMGFTLIEASMHSKPLVGTLHGGIPEIIKEGKNGLLVPENSPIELAAALVRILSDEELAKRLGKNALEMAEDKFTWRAATDRLLESYVR